MLPPPPKRARATQPSNSGDAPLPGSGTHTSQRRGRRLPGPTPPTTSVTHSLFMPVPNALSPTTFTPSSSTDEEFDLVQDDIAPSAPQQSPQTVDLTAATSNNFEGKYLAPTNDMAFHQTSTDAPIIGDFNPIEQIAASTTHAQEGIDEGTQADSQPPDLSLEAGPFKAESTDFLEPSCEIDEITRQTLESHPSLDRSITSIPESDHEVASTISDLHDQDLSLNAAPSVPLFDVIDEEQGPDGWLDQETSETLQVAFQIPLAVTAAEYQDDKIPTESSDFEPSDDNNQIEDSSSPKEEEIVDEQPVRLESSQDITFENPIENQEMGTKSDSRVDPVAEFDKDLFSDDRQLFTVEHLSTFETTSSLFDPINQTEDKMDTSPLETHTDSYILPIDDESLQEAAHSTSRPDWLDSSSDQAPLIIDVPTPHIEQHDEQLLIEEDLQDVRETEMPKMELKEDIADQTGEPQYEPISYELPTMGLPTTYKELDLAQVEESNAYDEVTLPEQLEPAVEIHEDSEESEEEDFSILEHDDAITMLSQFKSSLKEYQQLLTQVLQEREEMRLEFQSLLLSHGPISQLECRIQELQQEILQLQEGIQANPEVEAQISELDSVLRTFKETLQTRLDSENKQVSPVSSAHNEVISQNKSPNGSLIQSELDLESKNKLIARLQEQVRKLDQQVASIQELCDQQAKEIQELHHDLQSSKATVDQMRSESSTTSNGAHLETIRNLEIQLQQVLDSQRQMNGKIEPETVSSTPLSSSQELQQPIFDGSESIEEINLKASQFIFTMRQQRSDIEKLKILVEQLKSKVSQTERRLAIEVEALDSQLSEKETENELLKEKLQNGSSLMSPVDLENITQENALLKQHLVQRESDLEKTSRKVEELEHLLRAEFQLRSESQLSNRDRTIHSHRNGSSPEESAILKEYLEKINSLEQTLDHKAQEYDHLKSEVNSLRSKLNRADNQIKSDRSIISQQESSIRQLSSQLESMTQKQTAGNTTIHDQLLELNSANAELHELKDYNSRIESELENARNNITKLRSESQQAEEKLNRQANQLQQLNDANYHFREENSRLKSDNKVTQAKLQKATELAEQRDATIAEYEAELVGMQNALEARSKDISMPASDNSEVIDALKQEVVGLKSQVEALQSNKAGLEIENRELLHGYNEAVESKSKLETTTKEQSTSYTELEIKFQNLTDEHNQLKIEFAKMSCSLSSAESVISSQRDSIAHLQSSLDDTREIIKLNQAEDRNQVSQMTDDVRLQPEADESKAELDRLKVDYSSLKNDYETLSNQFHTLQSFKQSYAEDQALIQQLKSELDKKEQSLMEAYAAFESELQYMSTSLEEQYKTKYGTETGHVKEIGEYVDTQTAQKLDEARATVESLQLDLQHQETLHRNMMAEKERALKEKKGQITTLQEELRIARLEQTTIDSDAKTLEEELTGAHTTITELKRETAQNESKLQSRLENVLAENDNLKAETQRLTNDSNRHISMQQELEAKLEEVQSAYKSISSELSVKSEELQEALASLQSNKSNAEIDLQLVTRERVEVESQLAAAQEQIEASRSAHTRAVESLQAKIEDLTTSMEAKEVEYSNHVDQLKLNIEQLQTSLQTAHDQMESHESERQGLDTLVEALKRTIEEQGSQIETLQSKQLYEPSVPTLNNAHLDESQPPKISLPAEDGWDDFDGITAASPSKIHEETPKKIPISTSAFLADSLFGTEGGWDDDLSFDSLPLSQPPISDNSEIEEKIQSQLTSLQNEISALRARNQELEEKLAQLTCNNSSNSASLEAELSKSKATIQTLQAMLSHGNSHSSGWDDEDEQLGDSTALVPDLKREVGILQQLVEARDTTISDLKLQNQTLQGEIQNSANNLESVRSQLEAKYSHVIADLESELEAIGAKESADALKSKDILTVEREQMIRQEVKAAMESEKLSALEALELEHIAKLETLESEFQSRLQSEMNVALENSKNQLEESFNKRITQLTEIHELLKINLETQVKNLSNEKSSLISSNEEMKGAISRLEEKLAELEDIRQENTVLQSQLVSTSNNVLNTVNQNAQTVSELTEQNDSLKVQLENLLLGQLETAPLRSELEELRGFKELAEANTQSLKEQYNQQLEAARAEEVATQLKLANANAQIEELNSKLDRMKLASSTSSGNSQHKDEQIASLQAKLAAEKQSKERLQLAAEEESLRLQEEVESANSRIDELSRRFKTLQSQHDQKDAEISKLKMLESSTASQLHAYSQRIEQLQTALDMFAKPSIATSTWAEEQLQSQTSIAEKLAEENLKLSKGVITGLLVDQQTPIDRLVSAKSQLQDRVDRLEKDLKRIRGELAVRTEERDKFRSTVETLTQERQDLKRQLTSTPSDSRKYSSPAAHYALQSPVASPYGPSLPYSSPYHAPSVSSSRSSATASPTGEFPSS